MRNRTAEPEPGIRAFFDGDCPVCGGPIVRNVSRIYARHGVWRHCSCAPGASDE